jgi:hypothetical protein
VKRARGSRLGNFDSEGQKTRKKNVKESEKGIEELWDDGMTKTSSDHVI